MGLTNCHTMDELRLTGNCMRGSRPILTFDAAFDTTSHLRLLKTIFTDVFGTPRGHPKSKPFVDRVMAFYYADNKVRLCFYFIINNIDRSNEQITMRGCARSFFKSLIILMMSVYQT